MTSEEICKKGQELERMFTENMDSEEREAIQQKIHDLIIGECYHIKIQFSTLDENLCPAPELINTECPHRMDGKCSKCPNYVGFEPNRDGTIFSYMVFDGYCAKTKMEEE